MRVSIIGLGLIGGSIGLALKKTCWHNAQIVSFVRRQETGELAMEMQAIDQFEMSLVKAIEDADIVILSTPIMIIKDIFVEIAPALKPGCIVTDTASTKLQILRWAKQFLPDYVHFVGGHPMAGKETSGLQAADASLFHNTIYCLVQDSGSTESDVSLLMDMVTSIGASYFFINPDEHDHLVAGISHLPLLVSSSLTSVTSQNPCWQKMSYLASSGYRDSTRLSSGNPELNGDIVTTNKEPILYWMDNFIDELQNLRTLIDRVDSKDSRIYDYFIAANTARREWLKRNYSRKSNQQSDSLEK